MTSFTVAFRGTTLELALSPQDCARVDQEAAWAAQKGVGYLVQARGPVRGTGAAGAGTPGEEAGGMNNNGRAGALSRLPRPA